MKPDDMMLWSELTQAGLVDGAPPEETAGDSPWYIRTMMGVAGWVGALFLLGFFVLSFSLFKNESAAMPIGALLCVAAVIISRIKTLEDFGQQFCFALSLAGQILILIGLLKYRSFSESHIDVAMKMALLELFLFVLISNPAHRVWAAVTGFCAVTFVLHQIGLRHLGPAIFMLLTAAVWVNEFRFLRYGSALRAIGYGVLAMACLPMFYFQLMDGMGGVLSGRIEIWLPEFQRWLGMGIAATTLIGTVIILLSRARISLASKYSILAIGTATAIAGLSPWLPGLPVILMAVLIGFAHGNRLLVGLAVFSMLAYLSQYYYWLDITLLYKSILLMAAGTLLILARFAMHVILSSSYGKGEGHA